jgi:hypothetical protein
LRKPLAKHDFFKHGNKKNHEKSTTENRKNIKHKLVSNMKT